MGEYKNSLRCHYESLNILQRVYNYNPSHKRIAQALNDIGVAFLKNGYYDKSIEHLQESLDIRLKIYETKPNELIIETMNNLTDAYFKKSDLMRQEEFAVDALDKSERFFKQDHPEYAKSLNNMGNMYFVKV